jgi:hypothetical protein
VNDKKSYDNEILIYTLRPPTTNVDYPGGIKHMYEKNINDDDDDYFSPVFLFKHHNPFMLEF